MGTWPAFKAASFCSSLSTRTTSCPRSAKHAPATSPTYPDPTTAICIRCSGCLARTNSTITLSVFPAEVARITYRRIGQTSHLYVTTVTASAEATLGTRDVDRRCPKLQDFERTIQVMRLRFSLAFQLPPAENSCPSARTLTPPLSPAPKYSQSQTLPVPMNNQTCRSAGTQSNSSAPRIKSRADTQVLESTLALNPVPIHSGAPE